MLQEVITYLIISSAATIAIFKLIKRFHKKKPQKVDLRKENISMEHNCSECAAECLIRDMPKRVIESSSEVCKKVEIKSE